MQTSRPRRPSRMEVNVVRTPDDTDFDQVKQLCQDDKGWTIKCSKKHIKVYTKPCDDSAFNMIKTQCEFPDIAPDTLYDVLHDADYRPLWDKYQLDSEDVGLINPNNEICYYALRSMPPLRHRDFVLQRSWLDLGDEKYIFNHSVCHDDYPPRKGIIRGTTFLTCYLITPLPSGGCHMSYVTHSDPKGKLPSWLINRITHHVCPKMMRRLHKACLDYGAWKAISSPHWRPWARPDQQCDMNRVDLSKCGAQTYDEEIPDESVIDEANMNLTDE